MRISRLALLAFLVLGIVAAQHAHAADDPVALPATMTPALAKLIDESLGSLVDGSDDDKQLAEDRLYNVPLPAFPLVEAGLKRPGMDAESRQRLVRLVGHLQQIVKLEAAAEAMKQHDFEWNQRTALEAYDHAGRHDPKWDDQARAAIRQFTSRFAADRAAAFVTLEHITSDLKCDDPLILYMDARDLEDASRGESELAKQARRIGEALSTYLSSCDKFEKSDYPADRKCYALAHAALFIMKTTFKNDPALKAKARTYADEALDLVPLVVKEKGVPERWLTDIPELIVTAQVDCGVDRGAVVDELFPTLLRALPDRPGPLAFKGHQYTSWAWDARGSGLANTVTPEGWKRMKERLADAEGFLTKAYDLDPSNPAAAVDMLTVELGQGKGRNEMEKWFQRAIAADPESADAYQAKLYYLEPKWYGSPQDMIAFGHQCLATRDWRGGITYVLLKAHNELAKYAKDETAYFHDPAVWKDIQSVVGRAAEIFPDSLHERTMYAYWAWRCGQWFTANAQFKLLGGKIDASVFGNNLAQIERARAESATKAAAP